MTQDDEIARLKAENAALRAQLDRARALGPSAPPPDDDADAADLADQRALFANFLEHLPVGVCLVDKDGKLLLSNPAYRHFLPDAPMPSRLPPGADRGRWRSWDAHGQPIPREQFVGARALRGELVVPGVDCLYDTPDGRTIWTRVSGVPLRNASDDIIATALVILDIDAEVRARELLRKSEAHLDALVRSSSEVRYSVNADWTELLHLAGGGFLPDTTAPNADWLNVYVPDADQELVQAEIARAVRSGSDFALEHRVKRLDGQIGWAATRAVPLTDAAGAVTGWLGAASDITARKQAQAAMERMNGSLERLVAERTADRNALWRLSSDIMLRCTLDGRITAVNPAWTVLLGWREEELLGVTLPDLIHPDDRLRTADGVQALATDLGHARFENRFRHRDGSYRWISWSTSVADGLVNAVGRDVTADKEKAEALARIEDQLRQSQKMEAVGQLTGGLAHDFNNLLAAVMGNLELLQRKVARGRVDDLDRYIATAQGAGRRAASLTQRLLAFSRRQLLHPAPTDVNRLVADLEDMLRRTVGASVDIRVVAEPGLWHASIDRVLLENAILNLCINARDAMPDGGTLTLETANTWIDEADGGARDLTPGPYVSICVTDTGTGMAPDTIARAFEPFFTTKPMGQGTGLGLSMTYGFTRQSGGGMHIASELGRGTTVCIFLPRCDDDVVDERPTVAAASVAAATGQTVLVVDDETTVRHLIDEVLEEAGYTVIGVPDAAAALKVLTSGVHVDLLVTDVGLPGGMNGRQLADAALVKRPDLAVLFVTGFAEDAAVGDERMLPNMGLLTKPFTLEALTLHVAALMNRAGARRPV